MSYGVTARMSLNVAGRVCTAVILISNDDTHISIQK